MASWDESEASQDEQVASQHELVASLDVMEALPNEFVAL